MLLDAGADVNALESRRYGRTALEGAAENGRIDMVLWLLKAGAKTISSRARQLALGHGHFEVETIIGGHDIDH